MQELENTKGVGQKFSYKRSKYKLVAVSVKDCRECAFYDMCDEELIKKTIGSCVAEERDDHTEVIVIDYETERKTENHV